MKALLIVCILGPVVMFSVMFMAYMILAKRRGLKARDVFDVFMAELVISFILMVNPLFILPIASSFIFALMSYYLCKTLTKGKEL